jgi:hypothetical protein
VACVRYIDSSGNPSNLSPFSNVVDTGHDGLVEMLTVGTGSVTVQSGAHGLVTGDAIVIAEVSGEWFSLLNGTWSVTVLDADNFTVPLTIASGTFQYGGTWALGVSTLVYGDVPTPVDQKVARRQILRNLGGTADVFYVDIDTDDLTSTVFMSTAADEDLAGGEAVPLTYGDDDLPWANRFGVPPGHKPLVAVHQGRAFAAGDLAYAAGHVVPVFNSTAIRGVGTAWSAGFAGRFLYVRGAQQSYEIASVDVEAQVLTLTAPYLDPPAPFQFYTIRAAPAERRLVYFSEPGTFAAWPAYNAVAVPEDSDDITGMFVKGPYLFIIEHRHIYRLTFQEDPLDDGFIFLCEERGCVNDRCHVTVEGVTYMLDEAGIHAFSGESSVQASDDIQNVFQVDGTSDFQVDWTSDQRLWHAAHDPVRNTIRWFVTFVGLPPQIHCIAYNYRQKRFWIEQYPETLLPIIICDTVDLI